MPYSKTKELARQLGVIGHKRKQTTHNDGARKRRKGQLLSYLMVIDFESTCWENKRGQQEIIEFPAVLLDLSNGEVVGEFQQYVLPMEHPTLSDFCRQLTGITQEQVDNGVPIQTCLYLFKQWVGKLQQQTGLMMMEPGKEYSHDQQLCSIGTWSDWDLGVCLLYECRRKQVRIPAYFNQWVNIRALYKTFYERRPSGLKGSLEDLGMAFVGQEHSGIDDARNTAKLCYRMVRDGCKLNITKSIDNKTFSIIKPPDLKTAPQKSEQTGVSTSRSPTGSTTSTFSTQSNPSPRPSTCTLSKAVSPPNKQCTGELPTSQETVAHTSTVVDSQATEEKTILLTSHHKEVENAWDKFDDEFLAEAIVEAKGMALMENEHSLDKHFIQEASKKCEVPQTREMSTFLGKQYFNKSKQTPNRVVGHIVSPLTLFSSATSKSNILGHLPSSSTNHCSSNATPPMDLKRADIKTHCTTSPLVNSSSSYDTSTPHSSTLSINHKVTPPMCDCGRRTKRKLVSKSGPNEGKPFYVCPVSSGSNKGKGCGFFRWEGAQKENLFSTCNSVCTSSSSSVYSDM